MQGSCEKDCRDADAETEGVQNGYPDGPYWFFDNCNPIDELVRVMLSNQAGHKERQIRMRWAATLSTQATASAASGGESRRSFVFGKEANNESNVPRIALKERGLLL